MPVLQELNRVVVIPNGPSKVVTNNEIRSIVSAKAVLWTGGSTIAVNGVKVVGAQGAAVANATNTTDVITQLNELLARLRAHGLIAT